MALHRGESINSLWPLFVAVAAEYWPRALAFPVRPVRAVIHNPCSMIHAEPTVGR